MMQQGHRVDTEIAYDLMHDHLDTILSLLERPMDAKEATRKLGGDRAFHRLLRHGLIRTDGNQVSAVDQVYREFRQEGMMTFLEHYVLPSLTASIDDDGFAALNTLSLNLSEEAILGLRDSAVASMQQSLLGISERDPSGPAERLTVMVVGTSDVVREDMEPGDAALCHLQRASIQRSQPQEKQRAILSLFVSLSDASRYGASMLAVEKFVESLAQYRAEKIEDASYHVSVASHWRGSLAGCAPSTQDKRSMSC